MLIEYQFTELLDYYLSDDGRRHLPEINRLAKTDSPEADDKLLHYAMEGIRLNGTFGSYRQATTSMTVEDGDRPVSVKAGDKVFCSFVGFPFNLALFERMLIESRWRRTETPESFHIRTK